MKLSQTPHVTEEYYCSNCTLFFDQLNVFRNWKCPKCDIYIQIRILTDKLNNSCLRIPVQELKVDDMILIDRFDYFRDILAVRDEGSSMWVAIKEYRALSLEKNSTAIVLNGGWYHS